MDLDGETNLSLLPWDDADMTWAYGWKDEDGTRLDWVEFDPQDFPPPVPDPSPALPVDAYIVDTPVDTSQTSLGDSAALSPPQTPVKPGWYRYRSKHVLQRAPALSIVMAMRECIMTGAGTVTVERDNRLVCAIRVADPSIWVQTLARYCHRTTLYYSTIQAALKRIMVGFPSWTPGKELGAFTLLVIDPERLKLR